MDIALIGFIAAGDETALQLLFTRHKIHIHQFLLRLVGDEALAEDLVNEVFVDVWKNAGKFEGNSQVSTWVLAIARFKALSALRRRKDAALDDVEAAAIPDISRQSRDQPAEERPRRHPARSA